MAEVLEDFEFVDNRTNNKYPWDQWLDGQIWQLRKDLDFESEVNTMYHLIRRTCKSRSLLLKINCTKDSVIFKVTGKIPETEVVQTPLN